MAIFLYGIYITYATMQTGNGFIMGFWIRNAILAVILIGLAVAFFLYKDVLLAENQSAPQTSAPETKATEDSSNTAAKGDTPETAPPEKQQTKEDTNAAADGLSNFYAKIYGESNKRKVRNNVIFLPEPEGDIVKTLKARDTGARTYSKKWVGSKISRPFRKGETLYQKLSEYSAADGLDIIWWLDKDFIVKDPFRIDKDMLKTAKQVGQAISGHFPAGIHCYFCYRQRTLVFINEPPNYLNEECLLL